MVFCAARETKSDMPTYLLLLIAFLFPLFGYLFILGLINRRPTPLMVPGTWDFVGVLFGMSGFILAGLGYLFSRLTDLSLSFSLDARFLWIIAGLCFLAVVFGAVLVLMQRRACTLVYNIEPPAFERVLTHVLENKGFQWSRSGDQLVIQSNGEVQNSGYLMEAEARAAEGTPKVALAKLPAPALASLTLRSSRLGRCVAMRWEYFGDQAEQGIRREIERSLENELAGLACEDNPLAGWLLSISILVFTILLTLVVMLVLIAFRLSRS